MNLYLISQKVNQDYDTYSDAVVAAPNIDEARKMHPDGDKKLPAPESYRGGWAYRDWVEDPAEVEVHLIGTAIKGTKRGVICASFHAG